jgi:hypothetical protein
MLKLYPNTIKMWQVCRKTTRTLKTTKHTIIITTVGQLDSRLTEIKGLMLMISMMTITNYQRPSSTLRKRLTLISKSRRSLERICLIKLKRLLILKS